MVRNPHWIGWASLLLAAAAGNAGTIRGYVRDQNWYARNQNLPLGVGYYEYAVNANPSHQATAGGASATDVFGQFQMSNLAAGNYSVASWDVWWRSAYVFDVPVPAVGEAPVVDLRLNATMWGYPAFWEDDSFYEFGQTFEATGPVVMIYLRNPLAGVSYRLTLHKDGPGGVIIGRTRTFSGQGDHRLIYGYGDMPTVAGQTYYVRIVTSSPANGGILRQMDPRPDYSDPMPGGSLWLGDGGEPVAVPDRDLGLVIMSDDDGLWTNLYARQSGGVFDAVTSAGQSFVARGVNLISAAFWLADPADPEYEVRVYAGGPGGSPVGTAKRGRPARRGADPEMIVVWAPGECPLQSGQTYYVEVRRADGAQFYQVYVNQSNPFPYGVAYRNGSAVVGTDLAGTLMEEASAGSAARRRVAFVEEPSVTEAGRGADWVTVNWRTAEPSTGTIRWAAWHGPYTQTNESPGLVTDHSITLSNLQPHTLYHAQVLCSAENRRPAVSRDWVFTTRPDGTNLLLNPGFEEGSGSSPRDVIPGWTRAGSLDIKATDGSWFGGVPPHTGQWCLEGAVNGGSADAVIYQRVAGVGRGDQCAFSAWVSTWMRENNTWKYDVWNDPGRLSYVRLGIDPLGGTNPQSGSIRWTPRFYSHLRYCNPALRAEAQTNAVTVFVEMKGQGGQWHLYGIDDAVLTSVSPPARLRVSFEDPWVRVEWDGGAWTLQMAQFPIGPWVNLVNVKSPFEIEPIPAARFFRLRR